MTHITLLLVLLGLAPQAGVIQPVDVRSNLLERASGSSWRVFAVNSNPDGPLQIKEVQEVKQHNPPSTWGVVVQNASLGPVASYAVTAAVVLVDGTIKGIHKLPTVKNLGPSKVRRQEARISFTTINPTDRIVFYVSDVTRDEAPWQAAKGDVQAAIKAAAKLLPVP